MTLVEMKAELSTRTTFSTESFDNERLVRKAVSELRKEGIIFIPVKSIVQSQKHWYIRDFVATHEQVEAFYQSQVNHLKSQYHNTVRPLSKHIRDERLTKLMGRLEEAFQ